MTRKTLALSLSLVMLLAFILTGCTSNETIKDTTAPAADETKVDNWKDAPRKCCRTWYSHNDDRDEDCPGYKPNPDHKGS